jgi:hypothetical protein
MTVLSSIRAFEHSAIGAVRVVMSFRIRLVESHVGLIDGQQVRRCQRSDKRSILECAIAASAMIRAQAHGPTAGDAGFTRVIDEGSFAAAARSINVSPEWPRLP